MVTELQSRQGELQKKQREQEALNAKIRAMESKLLIGGKSIVDHTNEQERELEKRRLKLAEEQVSGDLKNRAPEMLLKNIIHII